MFEDILGPRPPEPTPKWDDGVEEVEDFIDRVRKNVKKCVENISKIKDQPIPKRKWNTSSPSGKKPWIIPQIIILRSDYA